MKVLTNGRFSSVRHRALTNSSEPRLSVIYFGAPSLQASISAPPEMLSNIGYSLYRTFTWAEFKDNFYRGRLAEGRLNYFKNKWIFGLRWSWLLGSSHIIFIILYNKVLFEFQRHHPSLYMSTVWLGIHSESLIHIRITQSCVFLWIMHLPSFMVVPRIQF